MASAPNYVGSLIANSLDAGKDSGHQLHVDSGVTSSILQRDAFIPGPNLPIYPSKMKTQITPLKTSTYIDNGNEYVINFQATGDAVFMKSLRLWMLLEVNYPKTIFLPGNELAADQAHLAQNLGIPQMNPPQPNKMCFTVPGGLWAFFSQLSIEVNSTVIGTFKSVPLYLQAVAEHLLDSDNNYDAVGDYTNAHPNMLYPVFDFVSPVAVPQWFNDTQKFLGTKADIDLYVATVFGNPNTPLRAYFPFDIPFSVLKTASYLPTGTLVTLRLTKEPQFKEIPSLLYNSNDTDLHMRLYGATEVHPIMENSDSILMSWGPNTTPETSSKMTIVMTSLIEEINTNAVKAEAPMTAAGTSMRQYFYGANYISQVDVHPPIEGPVYQFLASNWQVSLRDIPLVTSSTIPSEIICIPLASWVTIYEWNNSKTSQVIANMSWLSILPGAVTVDNLKVNNTYVSDFAQTFAPLQNFSPYLDVMQNWMFRDYINEISGTQLSMTGVVNKKDPRRMELFSHRATNTQNHHPAEVLGVFTQAYNQTSVSQVARDYNTRLLNGPMCLLSPNVDATFDRTTLSRTGAYSVSLKVNYPCANTAPAFKDGSYPRYIGGFPHPVPWNSPPSDPITYLQGLRLYFFQKQPQSVEISAMGGTSTADRLDLIGSSGIPSGP